MGKDKHDLTFNEHLVYYLFGFMPLFVTFFVYPDIPDKIAFHYNYIGHVSKLEHKEIILIVPFILSVITYLFPNMIIFKYGDDFEDKVSRYSTLLFMLCVNLLVYIQIYISLHSVDEIAKFNLYNLFGCAISLFAIFLGNIFSKGDRDNTFCIKTSTYFMSNKSWKLLHNHLGSYLASSGIVCLPISLFCTNEYSFYVLILESFAIIIGPVFFVLLHLYRYQKNTRA